MLGIAIGIIIMGIVSALYAIACLALYPVYKATGGKLGLRAWWDKMDF